MIDTQARKGAQWACARYSELNIIQKINVKANRVACNTMYGIDVDGWIPIHTMYSDFEQQQRDYCSPFEFAKHN